MLPKILAIVQIVLAVLLVIAILLQQKGSGLGAAFGGLSNIYTTKRGIDKILFQLTIAFAILFFVVAVVNLVI